MAQPSNITFLPSADAQLCCDGTRPGHHPSCRNYRIWKLSASKRVEAARLMHVRIDHWLDQHPAQAGTETGLQAQRACILLGQILADIAAAAAGPGR